MKRIIKQAALILVLVMLFGSVAPAKAEAAGSVDSVAIKLSMPPVDCGDVSAMKVTATASGCYIAGWVWKDIYGGEITEKFDSNNATIEIYLEASPGHTFSDAVQVSIDGLPVGFVNEGTHMTVSKTFSPVIWAPSVAKHPADEEVEIGKIVSFVAYGSFVNESKWLVVDPEGNTFEAEDLPEKVPGVKVTVTYDKLNISPAKYELNGYKVKCEFKGPGGEIESRPAKIIVVDKVEEKKEEQGVDEEHEHLFSEEITKDAGYHWYDCECGARKNRDEHRYVWTQIQPADLENEGYVTGVCSVCGYTLEAETQLSEEEKQKLREKTAETKPAEAEALPPVPADKANEDAQASGDMQEGVSPSVTEQSAETPATINTPEVEQHHKPTPDILPGSIDKPSPTPSPEPTPSPRPSSSPSPSPTAQPEKQGFFNRLFSLFK